MPSEQEDVEPSQGQAGQQSHDKDGLTAPSERIIERRSPSYSPQAGAESPSARPPARSRSRSYEDQRMSVERSSESDDGHRSRRRSSTASSSRFVEVRGLTQLVFERHVREIFRFYGRVVDVVVATEGSRTAYLTFESADDASAAVRSMNDGQIDGVLVSVRKIPHVPSFALNRPADRRFNRPRGREDHQRFEHPYKTEYGDRFAHRSASHRRGPYDRARSSRSPDPYHRSGRTSSDWSR